MSIIAESRTEPGPNVQIHCPACGACNCPATTYNQHDRGVIYIVPVWSNTSWVICSACGECLRSDRDVKELAGLSADELAELIRQHVSPVGITLAASSLVAFCLPVVGLLCAIGGLLINRHAGFWRGLSWVGVGIGAIVNVAYLMIFLRP